MLYVCAGSTWLVSPWFGLRWAPGALVAPFPCQTRGADDHFPFTGCAPPLFGAGDDNAVSVLQAVSRVVSARVSRHARWAHSLELQQLAPHLSTSTRRCVGWLRDAGASVAQAARLLGDERKEKQLLRRVLQDEIQTLRTKVCERVRCGNHHLPQRALSLSHTHTHTLSLSLCPPPSPRFFSLPSPAICFPIPPPIHSSDPCPGVPSPLFLPARCPTQADGLASDLAAEQARARDAAAAHHDASARADAELASLKAALQESVACNVEAGGDLEHLRAALAEATEQAARAGADLAALREANASLAASHDLALSRLREQESKGGLW